MDFLTEAELGFCVGFFDGGEVGRGVGFRVLVFRGFRVGGLVVLGDETGLFVGLVVLRVNVEFVLFGLITARIVPLELL